MQARFSAVADFRALVRKIVTAHRVHGVCPARLAAFFSEERGCAALPEVPCVVDARRRRCSRDTRAMCGWGSGVHTRPKFEIGAVEPLARKGSFLAHRELRTRGRLVGKPRDTRVRRGAAVFCIFFSPFVFNEEGRSSMLFVFLVGVRCFSYFAPWRGQD